VFGFWLVINIYMHSCFPHGFKYGKILLCKSLRSAMWFLWVFFFFFFFNVVFISSQDLVLFMNIREKIQIIIPPLPTILAYTFISNPHKPTKYYTFFSFRITLGHFVTIDIWRKCPSWLTLWFLWVFFFFFIINVGFKSSQELVLLSNIYTCTDYE
jgi:hypothetical protein